MTSSVCADLCWWTQKPRADNALKPKAAAAPAYLPPAAQGPSQAIKAGLSSPVKSGFWE
jgi:hypothetical protein